MILANACTDFVDSPASVSVRSPCVFLDAIAGPDVVLEGRCTTLTGLSDFVSNLEGSRYFKRSIEIVSTTTETIPQPPGELIKFTIKGQFLPPGQPPAAGAPAPAAARAGRP